ncbi:unnamed protein product, partial [Symbiodinium sp. CCMP2456]
MFDAQQKQNSRRTFTKWAKYGIVSARSMQSCAIRKHAESAVHQAAFRFYFMPASLETLPVNRDADLALLRGSVPQPSDWLQALAAAKESLSSRTAMRLSLTDQFVHSTRACISAITDRAVAQMHTILQETIRGRKRKLLAEASSISLTVDDKSPFRLVRFKAASGKGEVSSGILCLIKPSKMLEDDPEAWDNDKSQLAADSIAAGIKEFCTRLHSDTLDAELYSHILCSIHSFSADGASYAQKVGKLLRRRHCRNIAVIWRDSSHMLRLAAQNPLDGLTVYSNAYEALFGCKGPLPMLQHSHEWRSKLASLSRRMLQDELLGRFCFLVQPIALLLAMVAGDVRSESASRSKCHETLASLRPGLLVMVGLCADYMAEIMPFLRHFEKDVDVAQLPRIIAEFRNRLRKLFLECRILEDIDDSEG